MTKLALLFATIALSACISGESPPPPMTFDEFVAAHIQQDQGADGQIYLSYDWDTPLASMDEVKQLYAAYVEVKQSGEQVSESIVATAGGRDVIWPVGLRTNLTYCVSNSFAGNKAAVVQAMSTATAAWATASDSRVKFVYAPAQDATCTNTNTAVVFNVVPIQQQSGLYARAFFPNETRANRQVLINLVNAFAPNPTFPLAGILRHELGHSLGLRHETIRKATAAEYGTQCLEDMFYRDVIKLYDDESVMITPACLGSAEVLASNPRLDISFFDGIGIKKLYR